VHRLSIDEDDSCQEETYEECVTWRLAVCIHYRGLTVMFEILKTYGDTFLPHWWNDIFKIIFRIFDNMKHPESQYEVISWNIVVGHFSKHCVVFEVCVTLIQLLTVLLHLPHRFQLLCLYK